MNALLLAETAITAELDTDKAPIGIDARLALLERASARYILVQLNELPLEIAFGDLVEQFSEIVGFPVCDVCGCQPCINPSFCAACRIADAKFRRRRR
jgi:hypothetical protein